MKAVLEKIQPAFGSSFSVRRFTELGTCKNPHWHFHPEYEIVYISNGKGKRHIGDHISYYQDGDLIFLGPNLPHFGFTIDQKEEHTEIVVQMQENFLGTSFLNQPELAAVKQLFERSHQGLSFKGETKKRIGKRLQELVDLQPFDRLIQLLQVLNELALSEEFLPLRANGIAYEVNAQDHDRMNAIYRHVELNYTEHITLDEIAAVVNMTVPAFCRYFKKLTQKTFTHFVNEFRIAKACSLLAESHESIAEVSFASGFNNLSHFNKQFKLITNTSPMVYRSNLKKIVKEEI